MSLFLSPCPMSYKNKQSEIEKPSLQKTPNYWGVSYFPRLDEEFLKGGKEGYVYSEVIHTNFNGLCCQPHIGLLHQKCITTASTSATPPSRSEEDPGYAVSHHPCHV